MLMPFLFVSLDSRDWICLITNIEQSARDAGCGPVSQSEARAVARDASVAVDDVAPVAGAEGRAAIDLHISGPGLCSAGHSH